MATNLLVLPVQKSFERGRAFISWSTTTFLRFFDLLGVLHFQNRNYRPFNRTINFEVPKMCFGKSTSHNSSSNQTTSTVTTFVSNCKSSKTTATYYFLVFPIFGLFSRFELDFLSSICHSQIRLPSILLRRPISYYGENVALLWCDS